MKRNLSSRLMISMLLALLFISNCETQKTTKPDAEIAKKLIQTINQVPGIDIRPGNMAVDLDKNKNYIITLTNPVLDIDISELDISLPVKEMKVLLKLKEIVLKYNPEEEYLQLILAQDLVLDWNFPGVKGIGAEDKSGIPEMNITISVAKAAFKNNDFSPFLNTKAKNLTELMGEFLAKNQSIETVLDHVTYDLSFLSKEQKKLAFHLEIEKIEARQKAFSDIFISLYKKESKIPDISEILAQGKALFDLEMINSEVKLTVKENQKEWGGGTIENFLISYYLKPDDTRSFFVYGSNWDITNLKLSVPKNRIIELIGDIPQMKMKFSLENLSAAFIKAYMDLIKKNLAMSASMDEEKYRQQQMMMGLTIASEFMKSKPAIKCNFSPLKHRWGELEADINFKFLNLMAPPVGEAKVNIPKVKEILEKVKEETSLSPKTVEKFFNIVQKYVQVDENGNGHITFKTISDQPGTFFLNGKPIR